MNTAHKHTLSLAAVSTMNVGDHGSPLSSAISMIPTSLTRAQVSAGWDSACSSLALPLPRLPSNVPGTIIFSSPCFLMICQRKLIAASLQFSPSVSFLLQLLSARHRLLHGLSERCVAFLCNTSFLWLITVFACLVPSLAAMCNNNVFHFLSTTFYTFLCAAVCYESKVKQMCLSYIDDSWMPRVMELSADCHFVHSTALV